jgi:hypothetical protein
MHVDKSRTAYILFPIPPRRMTRISMSFPGLKQYVLIENKKV